MLIFLTLLIDYNFPDPIESQNRGLWKGTYSYLTPSPSSFFTLMLNRKVTEAKYEFLTVRNSLTNSLNKHSIFSFNRRWYKRIMAPPSSPSTDKNEGVKATYNCHCFFLNNKVNGDKKFQLSILNSSWENLVSPVPFITKESADRHLKHRVASLLKINCQVILDVTWIFT